MGAVAWGPLGHRPVSHPRSSNRTYRFPASGFPAGFDVIHRELGVLCLQLAPSGHVACLAAALWCSLATRSNRQICGGLRSCATPDVRKRSRFREVLRLSANKTSEPMVHVLFEILPADLNGPSLIPVKDHWGRLVVLSYRPPRQPHRDDIPGR